MRLLKTWLAPIVVWLTLLTTVAAADDHTSIFNMTPGVTPISRDIYDLHMTIFWVCVAIGVLVFGVLIYTLIMHRKAAGHQAHRFHSSFKVELLWTIIPFFILVAMAIPATLVLVRMEDNSKADVNIKVTGFQWHWQYEYLDYGIRFSSNLATPENQIQNEQKKGKWYLLEVDKPLVVPIHKKIRFLVTSNDVLHAWWVPALGIKRDAIPGFIRESWARIDKPGIYRGQCAELCGMNHGYMPIVVEAVSQADFDKWVAQQKGTENEVPAATAAPAASVTTPAVATTPTTAAAGAPAVSHAAPPPLAATDTVPAKPLDKKTLMSEGENIYNKTCSVCHKQDGSGMPPAFPALMGDKITTGPIANHIDIVLNGRNGTAMQAFGDQLSDEEIAAVVTYQRNAWGNADQSKYGKQAGGLVQPAMVTKQRQNQQKQS